MRFMKACGYKLRIYSPQSDPNDPLCTRARSADFAFFVRGFTEPFLHLANIGIVGEGIRGGGRALRVSTHPFHFRAVARFQTVFAHNVPVNTGETRKNDMSQPPRGEAMVRRVF